MSDTLNPKVSLLCKLASIAVHADEYLGPHGHPLDREALMSAINDPGVKKWISEMTAMALAPMKRHA